MSTSPFAPEKDWDDVQRVLVHGIRRKHYDLGPSDIDDVVSDTVVWLMGPWANTAPEDPSLAFKFAVWVGFKHASDVIKKIRTRKAQEVSSAALRPVWEEPMDDTGETWTEPPLHKLASQSYTTPIEDAYFENQEVEWATQVIEDYYQDHLAQVKQGQDPETTEWSVWVRDLISGVSLREAAKRRNLSRPTITKRRSRGLTQLVKRAERELV